jgi:hypothetical protein
MTVLGKPLPKKQPQPLPKPQPVGLVVSFAVNTVATPSTPPCDGGGRDDGWSKVVAGSIVKQDIDNGSTSASSQVSSPTRHGQVSSPSDEAGWQTVDGIDQAFGQLRVYEGPDEDFEVESTARPPEDAKTQLVKCKACKEEAKWKRMVKEWDTEDEVYYLCASCVMVREQLPDLRSAQLYIIRASPGFAKKSLKQKAWQDAIANVQREFKMLQGSRTQIRAINHATMQSLFSPMADAIARKHKHMQFLSSDMEVHKHMMQRMQTCTDTKEAQRLLEELDKLLDHSPLLAFQGKNQWEYQLASTYSDEYVSNTAAGTYMRFFFVCLGGGLANPCMTIQKSKDWQTNTGNPLMPKGWRCVCGTNYRTKYGVIVEIVAPGIDGILYCRAPVPDEHINDMRAIMHELEIKPTSPKGLYDAVPVCKPSSTRLIIQKEKDVWGKPCDNQWTFSSLGDYNDLPEFEWDQVFNLSGYKLPPAPLTKRQKKELNLKIWEESRVVGAT